MNVDTGETIKVIAQNEVTEEFVIQTATLHALQPDQILAKVLYFTVDRFCTFGKATYGWSLIEVVESTSAMILPSEFFVTTTPLQQNVVLSVSPSALVLRKSSAYQPATSTNQATDSFFIEVPEPDPAFLCVAGMSGMAAYAQTF